MGLLKLPLSLQLFQNKNLSEVMLKKLLLFMLLKEIWEKNGLYYNTDFLK